MTFGAKAGLNMQTISGGRYFEDSYKAGVSGGAFISVNRYRHGVRAEALVKTGRFNLYNGNSHYNTIGIDVPVLYEVKLIDRLWLQFGPQFSAMVSARSSGAGGNRVDVKNRFRAADLAAVGGLEVTLPYRLVGGMRYIFGFVDVNNTNYIYATPETWRNKSIQIYLGYRFF